MAVIQRKDEELNRNRADVEAAKPRAANLNQAEEAELPRNRMQDINQHE